MNNTTMHLNLRHRWKTSDFLPWEEVAETIPYLKTELNNNLTKSQRLKSSNRFLKPALHLHIKINAFRNHLIISVVLEKRMVNPVLTMLGKAVCLILSQNLKD